MAIQNRNKSAERIAELEQKVKELETQPPVPVPSAPVVDLESERRVAKMLKQLEELGETPAPALSDEELNKKAAEAERDRKTKEDAKKAQADADKKAKEEAAEQVKKARIAELKQSREAIHKNRANPGFMLAAATSNPAFTRDGNRALREIAAELQQLENPTPVRKSLEFDPEAYDRRQAAIEERELTARMLEGERIAAANRANARPAPISGGLGYCEGPEWNR